MTIQRMYIRFALSTVLIGSCSIAALAETIDDFNQLEPDSNWITVDMNEGQPWGPGVFDTSSGALVMRTTGEIPIIRPYSILTSGLMLAAWKPSLEDPKAFSNGSVRMKFRADSDADPSILMRGDIETFTAYDFAAGNGNFGIQLFVDGTGARLATLPDVEFNQGEDWWMEASAIGDELSMKVWKDGAIEPELPQLTITDSTLTEGGFGLGVGLGVNDSQPAIVNATFDDVSFVVPEPGANAVAILVAFVAFIRRNQKAAIR